MTSKGNIWNVSPEFFSSYATVTLKWYIMQVSVSFYDLVTISKTTINYKHCFRSRRLQMLFKIRAISFTTFTGKHLCWSLFNNVAGLQTCNFIKKILQRRCFAVNIAKFLITTFFYRTPLVAASMVSNIIAQPEGIKRFKV